ncbi:WhiB family transcriptional regulator [Mycobacterium sp. Z3061]|uniref:WhiB family transcriptional regulator n=1 Tax=Mycobacterium sp. Z3061 TaxID=3073562 RepID=UPI0028738005|nr:WhiB family transcriptional regulator [Mycobacterium sp. Z3061]
MSEIALASQPTGAPDLDWRTRAVCRTADAELLFVDGAQQRQAASICRNCPVKWECATVALDNKFEYGVWGGLTERQRRSLLKKYPDVRSWGAFLARHHAHRAPAGSG